MIFLAHHTVYIAFDRKQKEKKNLNNREGRRASLSIPLIDAKLSANKWTRTVTVIVKLTGG